MLDRTTLAGAALANVANSPWTGEREALLKRLWLADDMTAYEIASEIGGFEYCADGGKNAVIGKARRLGLKSHRVGRDFSGGRLKKPRAQTHHIVTYLHTRKAEARQRLSEQVVAEAAPVIFSATPCSLLELTDDTCRWPIGDQREPDFAFCGGMARNGAPYCAGHMRIAYQAPASRRDRRPVPA